MKLTKTYTASELQGILAEHLKWANGERGTRANLARADLTWANLTGADLTRANLAGANLAGANLAGADLTRADLTRANLARADLTRADLTWANLTWANLARADLTWANLTGADLTRANLAGANLAGANLAGANLPGFQIPQEGELIVWKKLTTGVCKLRIPPEAARTASLIGRKCRAEFVEVLECVPGPGRYDPSLFYAPGGTVRSDSYDPDIRVECSHGIHFFLTKEEAEAY